MGLGDPTRTLQALLAGLTMATSASVSGDVIQIAATAHNQLVELTIRNDHVNGARPGAQEELNLRLEQSNILSQRGEFEYGVDPLRVRLALPSLSATP